MRIVVLISILTTLLSNASYALPILLEKNYTNYAFGYHNRGCFIDDNGFVYAYDVSSNNPIANNRGRLGSTEIKQIVDLLEKAFSGQFTERSVMYDAGETLWSGTFVGKLIKLKSDGNHMGVNSATGVNELIQKIDTLCDVEFPNFRETTSNN